MTGQSVPYKALVGRLWRAAAARGGWYSPEFRCRKDGCEAPSIRYCLRGEWVSYCLSHTWEVERLAGHQAKAWARERSPSELRFYWATKRGFHGF